MSAIAGSEDGKIMETRIENYTYIFNSDGYPTKVTVEESGETTVSEITYK